MTDYYALIKNDVTEESLSGSVGYKPAHSKILLNTDR